jgi:sugar phosphate isomerase/epimerase
MEEIIMKYSVFTVGTPEYNLEETVAKLKEFGYDGVEWRVHNLPKDEAILNAVPSYWGNNRSTIDVETIEENAEQIKALCERYGIEITALATYLTLADHEKVEKVLKAAAKMGCPKIRVNVPGYNGTVNYNELFKKAKEDLKVLEKLAERYNVKINMEIHMGNIIPSASAAYRLVSGLNSKYVGIIHDAGNMVHEGFEQYKFGFELLGEYLDHVHIKNARWVEKGVNEEGASIWAPEWCPLRKGQVDFKKLFEGLKSVGYDGWLSLEDFSNEASTDEKLKDNIEFIKAIVSK